MTNKEYIEKLKFLKEELNNTLESNIQEYQEKLVPDATLAMPYGLAFLKGKIDFVLFEYDR